MTLLERAVHAPPTEVNGELSCLNSGNPSKPQRNKIVNFPVYQWQPGEVGQSCLESLLHELHCQPLWTNMNDLHQVVCVIFSSSELFNNRSRLRFLCHYHIHWSCGWACQERTDELDTGSTLGMASFWRCAIMATWSASRRYEPHQIVKNPRFSPIQSYPDSYFSIPDGSLCSLGAS